MIGVDIFFVLSGFLITTILRDELAGTGRLDLRRFYFRRAARLIPPLVLCMAGTVIGYALLVPEISVSRDALLGMLFISDYSKAIWGMPKVIVHTWSLSVEEHFYMVWPFFLIATRRAPRRILLHCLFGLFILATVWRIADCLIWRDWGWTYYRFDTRLSGMILGSLLAVRQWRADELTAGRMARISLYVLLFLAVSLRWDYLPSLTIGTLAADIFAATLIVSLTSGHRTPVYQALTHPALVYLGVISYSVYLWHYGIAFLTREYFDPISSLGITLATSVLLAALSRRFVEKPIKNWVNQSDAERNAAGIPNPAQAPLG